MEKSFIKKNFSLLAITIILVIISFVFLQKEIANLEKTGSKALLQNNSVAERKTETEKTDSSVKNVVSETKNQEILHPDQKTNNDQNDLVVVDVNKDNINIVTMSRNDDRLKDLRSTSSTVPETKESAVTIATVEKESVKVALNDPILPTLPLDKKLKEPAVPREIKENHVLLVQNENDKSSESPKVSLGSDNENNSLKPKFSFASNEKSNGTFFKNVSSNSEDEPVLKLPVISSNKKETTPLLPLKEGKDEMVDDKPSVPVTNPTAPVKIPTPPVSVASPALTPKNLPEPIAPISAPNDKNEYPIVTPTAPVKIPASIVKKSTEQKADKLLEVETKPVQNQSGNKVPSVVNPTAPVRNIPAKTGDNASPVATPKTSSLPVTEKKSADPNHPITTALPKQEPAVLVPPAQPVKTKIESGRQVESSVTSNVPASVFNAPMSPVDQNMKPQHQIVGGSKILENQFWYISSECVSDCKLGPNALCYSVLKDNAWQPSSLEDFSKGNNAGYSTVIFVHGNLTDASVAITDACALYTRMTELQKISVKAKPIRFVIWKWRSEKMLPSIRKDAQYKACLAECDGLCLAGFLNSIPPESRTSIFAFSFGAISFGNALNIIADPVKNRNMRGVLILAACDYCDYSNVGRFAHGLGSLKMLLNVYNPTDRALRFYPLLNGLNGPEATGVRPLPVTVPMEEGAFSLDSSCLGPEHKFVKVIFAIPNQVMESIIFEK